MITELCYKKQTKQTKNILTNMLYQIRREEKYHHLKTFFSRLNPNQSQPTT